MSLSNKLSVAGLPRINISIARTLRVRTSSRGMFSVTPGPRNMSVAIISYLDPCLLSFSYIEAPEDPHELQRLPLVFTLESHIAKCYSHTTHLHSRLLLLLRLYPLMPLSSFLVRPQTLDSILSSTNALPQ